MLGWDFLLALDNYELTLQRGSSFNLAAETCALNLMVVGSKAASDQSLQGLREYLQKKIPIPGLGDSLAKQVISLFHEQNLILPDGRLSIPMGLSGPTGKPEVEDKITPILEEAVLKALLPGK
jgi:hypothetical protein